MTEAGLCAACGGEGFVGMSGNIPCERCLGEGMSVEIGHNAAPASEEHAAAIAELEIEAQAYLTGVPIPNQQTADELGELVGKVRAAEKAADAARVEEKRPHDEAAKAVQDAYKPILDKAKRIQVTAKGLLGAWMLKLEDEKRERERNAREAAARLEEEARKARADAAGDLEGMEAAEELFEQSKTQAIAARVIAKQDSGVKAGGRKVALRTVKTLVVEDEAELMRWAWRVHRDLVCEFVTGLARKDMRDGVGGIPGTRVEERKEAA